MCDFGGHETEMGWMERTAWGCAVGGGGGSRDVGSTGEVEEEIVTRRVSVRWEEWEADAGERKTRR